MAPGVLAIAEGFVDDVPLVDFVSVASEDHAHVGLHAVGEEFAGGIFFTILIEPVGGSVVLGPDEAVADGLEAVGLGEVEEAIGLAEGGDAGLVLSGGGLHAVFGGDEVEVVLEEGGFVRVADGVDAEADADLEEALGGVL